MSGKIGLADLPADVRKQLGLKRRPQRFGDMKRAAAQALVERNAAACEAARFKTCRCACAGKLHGIVHSAAWQLEQVNKIADPENPDPQQAALDLHTWGAALAPRFLPDRGARPSQ